MILFFFKETPFVKGHNRTCIYDLPKHKHEFIPNEFMEKIKSFEHLEKTVIYDSLDSYETEWLSMLLDNEYCFFADNAFIDCFPDIDFTWKNASKITNTILDFDAPNDSFDLKILENLNCKHIVIRFTKKFPVDLIVAFLKNNLKGVTFKSIDILIEKNASINRKAYSDLKKLITREITQVTDFDLLDSFSKTTPNLRFKPKFIIGVDSFAESQQFNLFFNRKLYINSGSYFKNAIESNDKFLLKGNYENLEKKINQKKFKKLWDINKDKIDVCKDCEFRYMCVDNRIPIKRKENEYYYLTECSYNPYLSLWESQPEFLPLKEIGVSSDESSFKFDNERINSLVEEIWN